MWKINKWFILHQIEWTTNILHICLYMSVGAYEYISACMYVSVPTQYKSELSVANLTFKQRHKR